MYCTNCGKEVNENADICTNCGIDLQKKSSKSALHIIIFAIIIVFLVGNLLVSIFESDTSQTTEKHTQKQSMLKQIYNNDGNNVYKSMENMMDGYYKNVVNDEIQKYNMAKQQGDSMNACMSAGMIAQSYYELKDTQNYNKWKNIEKQSCSWMNY